MPSPLVAANAYAALAKIGGHGSASAMPTQGLDKGEGSFGAMLKDAIGSVMEAGRKSDAQTKALAAGKANVVDVVTAVAETEVAVETLVSVRDRVIQSYEDIMKMPI
jgi:flagellar hook-basal body complex protein FliE